MDMMSEHCIGWAGECPVHGGGFHGCEVPCSDHGGKRHRCACGATPGPSVCSWEPRATGRDRENRRRRAAAAYQARRAAA